MKKNKQITHEDEQIIYTDDNKKRKEKLKITNSPLKLILIVIVPLVLILTITVLLLMMKDDKSHLSTISQSSLQKVLEISELSTVDYTYNATATKYDDKNNAMYHVAYEGSVTAGIDFNKILIDMNENERTVKITIPEIEIHSTKVDMGTMEYIFEKEKYETENISQEAYKLCKKDLTERIKKENVLHESARENAISSVEALFKPWIDTLDNSYTIEIN